MKTSIKGFANSLLRPLGFELSRIRPQAGNPTLFECPVEALLFSQGGKSAFFSCPVEKLTHVTGLGLSKQDWNPFVETLLQYEGDSTTSYDHSKLKLFYERAQPGNAAESVFGFRDMPLGFYELCPHLVFLSPWSSLSEDEVTQDTLWWNRKDNTEHGCNDLVYPADGWAFFGPVSSAKGELEFRRTVAIYESIKSCGYDSRKGGIGVTVLKRGSEFRYLLGGGGYHRAVALKAAGYKTAIAGFHRNSVVDVIDVDKWPNVANGFWRREEALAYVDHLFDYDSINWARKEGLSL